MYTATAKNVCAVRRVAQCMQFVFETRTHTPTTAPSWLITPIGDVCVLRAALHLMGFYRHIESYGGRHCPSPFFHFMSVAEWTIDYYTFNYFRVCSFTHTKSQLLCFLLTVSDSITCVHLHICETWNVSMCQIFILPRTIAFRRRCVFRHLKIHIWSLGAHTMAAVAEIIRDVARISDS